MFKKIISFFTICLVLISTVFTGFAMETVNNVKFKGKSIEMSLTKANTAKQYTSSNSSDNSDSLSISLKHIDGSDQNQDDNFMAEGFLIHNDQKQKISAKGFLNVSDLSNGSQFYQGPLYGNIYDTNGQELDEIIMSIQYDSVSNKAFVSLTLGEVSEAGNSLKFLDFGEIPIESNEIYFKEKLNKIKKEKAKNSSHSVDSRSTMSANEVSLLGGTDNEVRLQDYTDGSGDNDDLIYLALFHPNELREGSDTNFYIRMWADTDEAEAFYESENGGNIVSGSGHCKKGRFYIQNLEGWQAEDQGTPGDDKGTVTIPIPYVKNGEVLFVDINFTMDSIEYERDNVNSNSDNKAQWTFERTFGLSDNINAESNKPWDDEDDENGLAGRVEFSFSDGGVDNDTTMSTKAYGKWYYTVVEDTGSGYYERDFSVSATLYDSIKVIND